MQRTRRGRAARLAAAAVVLVVAAGCGLGGNDAEPRRAGAVAVDPVADASTAPDEAVEPTPAQTTASPSAKATRKPTRKSPRKPVETKPAEQDRFWDQKPECATYEGTAVSKRKAKAALTTAAARVYWPTSAPTLRLPQRLVKAVAWQESGWQSNIVNCDGGYGLMQAMPDTVAQMNQRFEQSYDATKYRDNAFVGANYLAWLTKYFGEKYFGERYDLRTSSCRSHRDMCLLNMVIAAYNAGFGTVDESRAERRLPNPQYVDSVRSLMRSCYCDRY